MSDEKKEIVFGRGELTAEQKADYQRRIAAAKGNPVNALKGSEPLGSVAKPPMPNLTRPPSTQESVSPINDTGGLSPRPAGSPILRPETQQQLEEFTKAQQEELKNIAQEANKVTAEQKDNSKKDDIFESLLDLSDQRTVAEKMLDNRKRREEIESRCAPMKFEDLLYRNEVEQKVPIIPGKFEPTFRSLVPEETLFIKRYIAKDPATSDQYHFEKYNLCILACSLVAINDRPLPDHRDAQGNVDEGLFETKMKMVLKKSGYIVADLGVNYTWFDTRVRKLITADGLKNG